MTRMLCPPGGSTVERNLSSETKAGPRVMFAQSLSAAHLWVQAAFWGKWGMEKADKACYRGVQAGR